MKITLEELSKESGQWEKKSFLFLDILATIVDECEAIKMKKSLIVIGFLQ